MTAKIEGLADEGLAQWAAEMRVANLPRLRETGVAAIRASSDQRAADRPRKPDLPVVTDVRTDRGLALRLYRPAREPRPLALFLHGGGFVIGGLDSHDGICRRLAAVGDVAVLAVDYRRAPEHPGPAAVDDAVAAFGWARERADELGGDGTIGLAGDSAGGTLALLAAVRLRSAGTPAAGLLLAYPNADLTLSSPSATANGHGWGLEADDIRWFNEQWVPDPARRTDPELSPLHAPLAGLPPVLIATAEHDPLHDEGAELAERLRAAGVTVRHQDLPGLVHGFLALDSVSPAAGAAGDTLFAEFGQQLRGAS